jgi:hypothetical protein
MHDQPDVRQLTMMSTGKVRISHVVLKERT